MMSADFLSANGGPMGLARSPFQTQTASDGFQRPELPRTTSLATKPARTYETGPPMLLGSSSASSLSKPATDEYDLAEAFGGMHASIGGGAAAGQSGTVAFEQTLIVFDWDDTFFPTSALERNRLLRIPAGKLRPQVTQHLNALSQLCIEVLSLADRFGKVVIVTNSAPGWLDASCQAFMPLLHPKIRSYPIFAKPMNYLLTYKLDVFKREFSQRYTNLVSVGDGIAERTATLRLIGVSAPHTQRFCKSIKLRDLPTMNQLVEQLELVKQRFSNIVHYQGDLDIRANFGRIPQTRNDSCLRV